MALNYSNRGQLSRAPGPQKGNGPGGKRGCSRIPCKGTHVDNMAVGKKIATQNGTLCNMDISTCAPIAGLVLTTHLPPSFALLGCGSNMGIHFGTLVNGTKDFPSCFNLDPSIKQLCPCPSFPRIPMHPSAVFCCLIWKWLKKPVPKWNLGKWKHGPTPA